MKVDKGLKCDDKRNVETFFLRKYNEISIKKIHFNYWHFVACSMFCKFIYNITKISIHSHVSVEFFFKKSENIDENVEYISKKW